MYITFMHIICYLIYSNILVGSIFDKIDVTKKSRDEWHFDSYIRNHKHVIQLRWILT